MKPRSSMMLAFVLFLCGALVAIETALTSASPTINGWITAQKQTPALWTLDGCAVLILMVAIIFANFQESQAQIHRELVTQQQLAADEARNEVTKLKQQLEDSQAAMKDSFLRQNETNAELRSFSQANAAPLAEHITAVNRQIDTIHLALQYHRASLQQVNHQLRDVNLKLQHGATIAAAAEGPPRQITEMDAAVLPESDDVEVLTLNAPAAVIAEAQTIDVSGDPVSLSAPPADAVSSQAEQTLEVEQSEFAVVTPHSPTEPRVAPITEEQWPSYDLPDGTYVTNEEMALLTAPIVLDGDFTETTDQVDGTSEFHWPDELHSDIMDTEPPPGLPTMETAQMESPSPVGLAVEGISAAATSEYESEGSDVAPTAADAGIPPAQDEVTEPVQQTVEPAPSSAISADPREWFRKL